MAFCGRLAALQSAFGAARTSPLAALTTLSSSISSPSHSLETVDEVVAKSFIWHAFCLPLILLGVTKFGVCVPVVVFAASA
jgi:hypothetical protein